MGIMPVEFERACERRWIEKFGQPVPAAPLYEVNQGGAVERRDHPLQMPARTHEEPVA
jgi:hypothetical protein